MHIIIYVLNINKNHFIALLCVLHRAIENEQPECETKTMTDKAGETKYEADTYAGFPCIVNMCAYDTRVQLHTSPVQYNTHHCMGQPFK